jgi:hypothetical protein
VLLVPVALFNLRVSVLHLVACVLAAITQLMRFTAGHGTCSRGPMLCYCQASMVSTVDKSSAMSATYQRE